MISCVLNKLDIDYTAYTILGNEDTGLMKKRHSVVKDGYIIDMDQSDFDTQKKFLETTSEEYLLKGYEHCHRYRDYVQSTLNSDNVRLSLLADTPLFHKMSLLTGIEVTVKNVKPITDTIIILDEFAKELAASTTTKAS